MLVLQSADISKILTTQKSVEVAEQTFRELPDAKIEIPRRPIIYDQGNNAVWLFMPVHASSEGLVALKTISEHKNNEARFNLQKAFGMLALFKVESGLPLCMMDSVAITAIRTAAMGAVSIKHMAGNTAGNVGVLGSGRIAESQLAAAVATCRVSSARVYGPTPTNRIEYARKMSERLSIPVKAVETARDAVVDADILIAATNSSTPVLNGQWLKDGVHIVSFGTLPDRQELDTETFHRAAVIAVDSRPNVLREAGDIIQAVSTGLIKEQELVEMSDIVLGKQLGRKRPSDITVFKSVGLAFLDLTTARYVYEQAKSLGLGTEINL